MFCDLVGSTGLAARLDAEYWRNLVNTYLDEASKAVIGLGAGRCKPADAMQKLDAEHAREEADG